VRVEQIGLDVDGERVLQFRRQHGENSSFTRSRLRPACEWRDPAREFFEVLHASTPGFAVTSRAIFAKPRNDPDSKRRRYALAKHLHAVAEHVQRSSSAGRPELRAGVHLRHVLIAIHWGRKMRAMGLPHTCLPTKAENALRPRRST